MDETRERGYEDPGARTPEIERGATGVRILLTLLFAVIWRLVDTLVVATVALGLLWTLIVRRAPPLRVRAISNRLVTYGYQIGRYVTQNQARVPFPFSDFPEPLEPSEELGADSATELWRSADRPGPRGQAFASEPPTS